MNVHFSSATDNWSTPTDLWKTLNSEFHFNDDPCPINGSGGLDRPWGTCTFVNPPYSQLKLWAKKAYEESLLGKTIVMLIPSRTDTKYWHEWIMKAHQIRFCRKRLTFGTAKNPAPFPSCIVVFYGDKNDC